MPQAKGNNLLRESEYDCDYSKFRLLDSCSFKQPGLVVTQGDTSVKIHLINLLLFFGFSHFKLNLRKQKLALNYSNSSSLSSKCEFVEFIHFKFLREISCDYVLIALISRLIG